MRLMSETRRSGGFEHRVVLEPKSLVGSSDDPTFASPRGRHQSRIGAWALMIVLVGWSAMASPTRADEVDSPPVARVPQGALPNLIQYESRVLVGGVPSEDIAFRTLADHGVRTIVSVDGAVPDIEAARRHGIRYVHLPIGYEGIEPWRRVELARAVGDAREEGKVYVHCHHGRHRCAAAAGVALVSLGLSRSEEALRLMRRSGTSSHYPGLFRVVGEAGVVDEALLGSVKTPLPEIHRPSGVVESMLEAAMSFERIQRIANAGWKTPPDHPDLRASVEAATLTEALRLMREMESSRAEGDMELVSRAERSVAIATRFERLLLAESPDHGALDRAFVELSATCGDCHRAHRGGYRREIVPGERLESSVPPPDPRSEVQDP